ncbi:hypothetical protein QTP88_021111 [Uroleucon formosanum]
MLNKISEEVNSAGEYSITMDSTMDISTHDQCVFVLLYVRDTVNDNISRIYVIERVVALKKQTTSYSVTVISFFGLMQELYVFFKESYKRLNIYEGNNYRSSHLINIGDTRWRCISDSVQKIFGRADMWIVEAQHGERKSFIYVKIVLSLYEISQSNDFNVNVRSNARILLGRLTSYETALTQNQRNFTPISTAAKIFNNFVSEKIWEEENKIEVEYEILQKRKRIVSRRLESNIGQEETIHTPEDNFKINTYFPTMDVVVTSMEQRFAHCKELYTDLKLFDPRRFKDIRDNGINPNAMNEISQLLPTIDNHVLLEQLKSFTPFWPTIPKTTLKNTDDNFGPEYDSEDYFEDDNFVCKKEENYISPDAVIDFMCEKSCGMLRLLKV